MTIQPGSWRKYSLTFTGISINLAVVYTLLVPSVGNRSVADFNFSLPLTTNSKGVWTQKLDRQELEVNNSSNSSPEMVNAHEAYRSLQQGRAISIYP